MASDIARVIALGASNLTRGFHTVVSTARGEWGSQVEVLAALGHGRSYGVKSQFLVWSLPGILQSELWVELSRLPPARTRALITDVGNDILYGASADQILAWIREAVGRLRRSTDDIVITNLPLENIRRLSNREFLFFRSLFVPRCRLTHAEVLGTAERVNGGLAEMAASVDLRFVSLKREWYGLDPIHLSPSVWRRAWQEILLGAPASADHRAGIVESWRLYFMRPQREWVFGWEHVCPQTGLVLPRGARVWLY
jgi:hypothetical protein